MAGARSKRYFLAKIKPYGKRYPMDQTGGITWTTTDLALFPEDGNRYETIDGQLFVTRALSWIHQKAATRISTALDNWSETRQLGEVVQAPGIIFSDGDNVIPDVAWASKACLATSLDAAGHLTAAPELIVECLSYGGNNAARDYLRYSFAERQLKLKLYSARGVMIDWIIDWQRERVEVYERRGNQLVLRETLQPGDTLTGPLF
jgi:Uma2 family endonuclease